MATTEELSEADLQLRKKLAKTLEISDKTLKTILKKINMKINKFHRNHVFFPPGNYNTNWPFEFEVCTLLQHVVQYGLWEFVPFVVRMGADVNDRDDDGRTILHEIALNGYDDAPPHSVLEMLITKENINLQTYTGKESAFHNACMFQPSMVPVLVQNGCNVNLRNHIERVGLHAIVSNECAHKAFGHGFDRSDMLRWITMCITAQSVSCVDEKTGFTPTFSALFFREWDNVALLLNHGASINHRNREKETPLMYSFRLDEGSHKDKDPTPLWMVKKLAPQSPLERYRALFKALHLVPDDDDWYRETVSFLLNHLVPYELKSLELGTEEDPGMLFMNGDEVYDPWREPCLESLVMLCTLLQETCFSKQVHVSMLGRHLGSDFGNVMESTAFEINTEPATLRKLSLLNIRSQVLTFGGPDGLDELPLPKYLISLLKFEPLARSIFEMWKKYRLVAQNTYDQKTFLNLYNNYMTRTTVPFFED